MRRLTRPFRHGLAVWALRAARSILRCLPKSWVPRLGSAFGRLVSPFAFRLNPEIENRLKRALESPPKVSEVWADLGQRLFEVLDAQRQLARVIIESHAEEVFERAMSEKKGTVLATLHIGNWELMAAALADKGYSVTSIATQQKEGPIHTQLAQMRRSLGVNTLHPHGGARKAAKRLKKGEAVGLFVDQNTSVKGRPLDFLGSPAHTPTTYERLVKMTGAVPLFIWNVRDETGRYVVHVERVPTVDCLEVVNARCERLIRTHPTQWVWVHDRWQNRSNDIRAIQKNGVSSNP